MNLCKDAAHRIAGVSAALWALLVAMTMTMPLHAQQTGTGTVVEVVVQNYQFTPAQRQVHVGDTVRWVNREKRTSHSVQFAPEQGGESERFFPQEFWEKRFERPGRYPYHCGPHPEMIGEIEVLGR